MKQFKTVQEYLNELDETRREQVELLRSIIVQTHPQLEEHIKWNSPSYVHGGEDRITFNTQNKENSVKLILHMGSTRKEDKKADPVIDDSSGLIVWNSNIRGSITFKSIDDIKNKERALVEVIDKWLSVN